MAYDYGGYERQKGDIDYQYNRDASANAYGRFVSQQRGQRQLGDMSRSYGRAYPGYKASFAGRGLAQPGVKSGTMNQSMQNFVGDYGRDYLRTQQDLTQNLQQYDLNQGNLDAWRSQALDDLEAQKANEITNAATNLQWLQDMLGRL